jgi:hypothetical protein
MIEGRLGGVRLGTRKIPGGAPRPYTWSAQAVGATSRYPTPHTLRT